MLGGVHLQQLAPPLRGLGIRRAVGVVVGVVDVVRVPGGGGHSRWRRGGRGGLFAGGALGEGLVQAGGVGGAPAKAVVVQVLDLAPGIRQEKNCAVSTKYKKVLYRSGMKKMMHEVLLQKSSVVEKKFQFASISKSEIFCVELGPSFAFAK